VNNHTKFVDRLNLQRHTLDHFFERVLAAYPNNTALALIDQEPITYAEFGRRVQEAQQKLLMHGVKRQDKVVILGPSSPNWAIAYMSITTMGAVAVPIMEEFPESDVEHTIGHSDAAAIFIAESLFNSLNLPSLDKVQLVINLDSMALLSREPAGSRFWNQLPERLKQPWSNPEQNAPPIAEDDLAQILYTSGTTGHSKGVMLTHKNLVTNLQSGPVFFDFINEKSVVLGILPLAHAFGLTTTFLAMIYCGATIYFLGKKPSPKVLMSAMQKVRPHAMGAVPLIFEKIYHRQVLPTVTGSPVLRTLVKVPLLRKLLYKIIGRKILRAFGGRIEGFFIGGASLNQEIELFMRGAGIPYSCGYGLSETSPITTGAPKTATKIGSVGYAIADVSVKIVDPDPQTGVGEILIKGPNVMRGYYKNEAATRNVFTDDGWLITGDRGILDEEGYLFIKGRSKNIILGPSGENIYPEVIEEKLKESLFVEEALVYQAGNQLVARIYLDYVHIESRETAKEEHKIAANITDILETVRVETNIRLPAFSQIQKVIEQRAPFIKTPTDKIKRAEYVPDYLKN
jgi:long-chain acyl-CoA synthetase